jgi:hypothetical protein
MSLVTTLVIFFSLFIYIKSQKNTPLIPQLTHDKSQKSDFLRVNMFFMNYYTQRKFSSLFARNFYKYSLGGNG